MTFTVACVFPLCFSPVVVSCRLERDIHNGVTHVYTPRILPFVISTPLFFRFFDHALWSLPPPFLLPLITPSVHTNKHTYFLHKNYNLYSWAIMQLMVFSWQLDNVACSVCVVCDRISVRVLQVSTHHHHHHHHNQHSSSLCICCCRHPYISPALCPPPLFSQRLAPVMATQRGMLPPSCQPLALHKPTY